jgi:hypothetical protein
VRSEWLTKPVALIDVFKSCAPAALVPGEHGAESLVILAS